MYLAYHFPFSNTHSVLGQLAFETFSSTAGLLSGRSALSIVPWISCETTMERNLPPWALHLPLLFSPYNALPQKSAFKTKFGSCTTTHHQRSISFVTFTKVDDVCLCRVSHNIIANSKTHVGIPMTVNCNYAGQWQTLRPYTLFELNWAHCVFYCCVCQHCDTASHPGWGLLIVCPFPNRQTQWLYSLSY